MRGKSVKINSEIIGKKGLPQGGLFCVERPHFVRYFAVERSEARNLFLHLPPHIIKKYSAVSVFYFELPSSIISKIVAVTLLVN